VMPVSLRKVDVRTPETLARSMAIQANISYNSDSSLLAHNCSELGSSAWLPAYTYRK
jgi:hypothetical protein